MRFPLYSADQELFLCRKRFFDCRVLIFCPASVPRKAFQNEGCVWKRFPFLSMLMPVKKPLFLRFRFGIKSGVKKVEI